MGRYASLAPVALAALSWGPVHGAGSQDGVEQVSASEMAEDFADPRDPPLLQRGGGSETTLESYSLCAMTPRVSIKPGLPCIINPGGDPSIEHARMATLPLTAASRASRTRYSSRRGAS